MAPAGGLCKAGARSYHPEPDAVPLRCTRRPGLPVHRHRHRRQPRRIAPLGKPRGDGRLLSRGLLHRPVGGPARGRRQLQRPRARRTQAGAGRRRVHDDGHVGRRRLRQRHRGADVHGGAAARAGAVGLCPEPGDRRVVVRAADAAPRLHHAPRPLSPPFRRARGGGSVSAGRHRRAVLDVGGSHRARHDVRHRARSRLHLVDRARGDDRRGVHDDGRPVGRRRH